MYFLNKELLFKKIYCVVKMALIITILISLELFSRIQSVHNRKFEYIAPYGTQLS